MESLLWNDRPSTCYYPFFIIQVKTIVQHDGLIQKLIDSLSSSNNGIVNNSLGTLANIAGDCAEYRDLLIDHSIIQKVDLVLQQVNPNILYDLQFDDYDDYVRNSIWLVRNICHIRDNSIPAFDKVKDCLPIARRFINHKDEDIRTDACNCFANFAGYNDDNVRRV